MIYTVLPFNKKIVELTPFTLQDALEFYYICDDYRTVIKKLESFIITKDLNVVEKLYSLFYLRDCCVGSLIKSDQIAIDMDAFLREFDEIIDINKKVKIDDIEIELDYPYDFSLDVSDETKIIKSVKIDSEKVYLYKLTNEDRELLINSLPVGVYKVLELFVKENINNLCVDTYFKKERVKFSYISNTIVSFLKNIFYVISPSSYRQYIFSLSRRMHDIGFLNNSTLVDVEDYLNLYVSENEENKNTGVQELDGL